MELFIIRHGQSGNNALGDVTQRDKDPVLTATGEQQAECVARFLGAGGHLETAERENGAPFLDYLYCSPMLRALKTARPIGEALTLVPEVWVDIHEQGGIYLDHGEGRGVVGYSGLTRSQILEQFPDYVLPDEVGEDGWWNRGLEEIHVCHGRAIQVARALEERAGEKVRIGLVTHGGFLNSLLKALENRLPGTGVYYPHNNTAITRISFPPETWEGSGNAGARLVVRYMNRVDHLSEELIT